MTLDSRHLAAFWRRCSLTSDFWARYTALFVPHTPQEGNLPRDAVEFILSYLLNELFENCAKFSSGPDQQVVYKSWVQPERMSFQFTNHIVPQEMAPFQKIIIELMESDVELLYFEKLEQNAESGGNGSGLGYLTLMKDYGIKFGFSFQEKSPESVAVIVQAHVNMKEEH
jgi:hypothetical protein